MYRDSGAKLCFCLYIFIVIVDVTEIDGFAIVKDFVASTNFTTSRIKRQNDNCRGYKCTSSGECIEEDKRCDGSKDCTDGSDELEDCKTAVKCPSFAFTCEYGACIDGFRRCDGKKDCHDNSDEAKCNNTGNTEVIVQTNCKSDQFECLSGQCISRDDKCNGVNDCLDKSDETKEACLNQYCPGFTFQCDYGACIDGFKKCDRAIDCFDGSDEKGCGFPAPGPTETPEKPTEKPTEAPGTTKPLDDVGLCLLPPHPTDGKWEIAGGGNGNEQPGMSVAVNTILLFSCKERHRLSTESNVLACLKDGWKGDPRPTCSILCDPLYSSAVTRVHCYGANQAEIKCSEATDGTRATFECETYYEPSDRSTTTRFCWQGMWNLPPPRCIPVCGEKKVSAEPLIINATAVSKGNYPWVTAIFQKNGDTFTNVCGGSMLTQRVILTAAHCVSNQYGDALPPEVVKVAVGKYYNRYQDTRDSQAQYSDAQEILVHYRYKGDFRRYRADIAFIITQQTLLLSKVVQPVCYSGLSNIHLGNGVEGIITGWGYTLAGGNPSDELKEVAIPFKDDATCYQELPPDWADKYFEADKFCAGHYNKSIAVCKGDSGGGLVFKNPRDGRFYVHGIVSIGKKVGLNCDIQLSSLYTRVTSYYDWLEQVTSRYYVSDNGVIREAKNLISDMIEER